MGGARACEPSHVIGPKRMTAAPKGDGLGVSACRVTVGFVVEGNPAIGVLGRSPAPTALTDSADVLACVLERPVPHQRIAEWVVAHHTLVVRGVGIRNLCVHIADECVRHCIAQGPKVGICIRESTDKIVDKRGGVIESASLHKDQQPGEAGGDVDVSVDCSVGNLFGDECLVFVGRHRCPCCWVQHQMMRMRMTGQEIRLYLQRRWTQGQTHIFSIMMNLVVELRTKAFSLTTTPTYPVPFQVNTRKFRYPTQALSPPPSRPNRPNPAQTQGRGGQPGVNPYQW